MNTNATLSSFPSYYRLLADSQATVIDNNNLLSSQPRPFMYITIFGLWALVLMWFQGRLWQLLDLAFSPMSYLILILFILFIDLAWLYGIFNLVVIVFGVIYNMFHKKPEDVLAQMRLSNYPSIAILYTTCNDFVEESVLSCVNQDYCNFTVYILDDSSEEHYKKEIDTFASQFEDSVKVIRRSDRSGFKAGNMNHGLQYHATDEPYFAIADADEILPPDFLKKLVPVMEADNKCGFVQANHQCNPNHTSPLAESMGVGIDIHWKYYQPLRNAYGFVMFLGHGALLRRACWEAIGGFPHLVSEDLAFAIDIREKGYRGRFVRDVVCYEDFPDTVRSFRIRHMKWTRGTCEFLHKRFLSLIRSRNISWTEKLDILFPTLNLPLTLLYFGFMVIANLGIPYFFGQWSDLTIEFGLGSTVVPVMTLNEGFESIYTMDFFLITILTFFAPVLCFIIGLVDKPLKLIRFISHSTSLYAALGPLSSIGVLAYMISGKAIFLVTGDKQQASSDTKESGSGIFSTFKSSWTKLITKSHPDYSSVQLIEIATGVIFALACLFMMQISFFGLCLAFAFMPIIHWLGWNHLLTKLVIHLPFLLITVGISLAGLSLFGMQTIFFGYGFHF